MFCELSREAVPFVEERAVVHPWRIRFVENPGVLSIGMLLWLMDVDASWLSKLTMAND